MSSQRQTAVKRRWRDRVDKDGGINSIIERAAPKQPEATLWLLKSSYLLLWKHYVFWQRVRARKAPDFNCGHTHCISQQLFILLQTSGGRRKDVRLFLWWVASSAVPDSAGTLNSHEAVYAFACPERLFLSDLERTCAAAGRSPFKACYLLLNKSAAGHQIQSVDGQRPSRESRKGLTPTPSGSRAL